MKMQVFLAFVLFAISAVFATNPYCELESCPGGSHTLCRWERYHEVSRRCGEGARTGTFDHYDKAEIRQALGSHLDWDDELEIIAQKFANQCTHEGDICHHVSRFLVHERTDFITAESKYKGVVLLPSLREWARDNPELYENHNRIGCGSVNAVNFYGLDTSYIVCLFGKEK